MHPFVDLNKNNDVFRQFCQRAVNSKLNIGHTDDSIKFENLSIQLFNIDDSLSSKPSFDGANLVIIGFVNMDVREFK